MDLKETLFQSLIKVFNDQEDANLSDENRVSKELEKINKKEEEEQEQQEEENNHHDEDESDEISNGSDVPEIEPEAVLGDIDGTSSDVSEIESEAVGESPEDDSFLSRVNINNFVFPNFGTWF